MSQIIPDHGIVVVNLNNDGQSASIIEYENEAGDAEFKYFDASQVEIPRPDGVIADGPQHVHVVLYQNGSVKLYESWNTATGDHVLLNFAEASGAASDYAFGSGGAIKVGALTHSDIVSGQDHTETIQDFANGHVTHYLLTSTEAGNPVRLEAAYHASAAGGDDPKLVVTLVNSVHGQGGNPPIQATSDIGNFDAIISNDGASIISNDGASIISNDGASLITNDGGSLISQDGASLITNDGGSLAGRNVGELVGKVGASIISNDGASIVSTSGSGIVGNGYSFDGATGLLSGAPDTPGAGAVNFNANFWAGVQGFSRYTVVAVDEGDSSAAAGATAITIGDTASGTIAAQGDGNWYSVSLLAGHTYVFDLKAGASGDGSLADPVIGLFDGTSTFIKSADDGGVGTNAMLVFTPASDGTYYLVARAFNDGGTGTYKLTADEGSANPKILSNGGGATAAISVPENLRSTDPTSVAVISGYDLVDGHTLTYSVSGEDALAFDLNQYNGILSFHLPIDFEHPHDVHHNNIYHITVAATDSEGHVDTQDLTITVTDLIEPVYGTHDADVLDATHPGAGGNGPTGLGEWIFALAGDDSVDAGEGDDSIQGGPGSDTIDGGEGDDAAIFVGSRAGYTINRDLLTGEVVVSGGGDIDRLTNVERLIFDDETITLQIRGTAASDVLEGTADDDELDAVTGSNDSVDGKGGNDRLVVDYSGLGLGVTFVVYHVTVESVTTDYYSVRAGGEGDPINEVFYTDIEAFTVRGSTTQSNVLHGAALADVLVGGSASDTLTGFGGDDIVDVGKSGHDATDTGADVVDMGAGDDLLIADYSAATVAVEFAPLGSSTGYSEYYSNGANGATFGGIGRLAFSGVDRFRVTTGTGDDSVTTGYGDDTLRGGGGNDTLNSSRGEAIIDGGDGVDQWKADLQAWTSGISLDLRDPEVAQLIGANTQIVHIERLGLTATNYADTITLGASWAAYDNQITTLGGSDTVTIRGGASAAASGVNTIDLGSGDDDLLIADYSIATTAITFTPLGSGTGSSDYYGNGANGAAYGAAGRLAFSGVDRFNVSTGSGDDSITTGYGNDTLKGGGGDDTLDSVRGEAVIDGGSGVDQWKADLRTFAAGIILDLTAPAVAQSIGLASTVKNIERLGLTATEHNDTITMGGDWAAYDNQITTLGGSDLVTIHGGTSDTTSGTNTVDMGSGDDDLLIADYASATVAIIFASLGSTTGSSDYYSNGINGAQLGASGRLAFSGVDRFDISTGAGNDSIVTGYGNDSISGGGGNDTLDSSRGEARIDGGSGIDQWKADLSQFGTGIELDLRNPAIAQAFGNSSSVRNVERLGLTATSHADTINLGSSFAGYDNQITTLAGSDTITIHGGATALLSGSNTLDMGSGDDDLLIADYAAATVQLVFGSLGSGTGSSDYYSDGLNGAQLGGIGRLSYSGIDRFNVAGGNGADSITTGAGNDTLAGNGGNDTLHAGLGSDTVVLAGKWIDYAIEINGSEVILADRRDASPTGIDHVFDAETFQFASGNASLAQLINVAPTDIALSHAAISENSANGTVVGLLSSTDGNAARGDTAKYTLLNSAGGRFAIDGGSLVVANSALVDYEAGATQHISVKVVDAGGLSFTEDFTIAITNVQEHIGGLTDIKGGVGGSIAENTKAGTAVGITARAVDPDTVDTPIHYTLQDNAHGHFAIDKLTGVVSITNLKIDREVDGSKLTIVARATSPDGSFATKSFNIAIGNAAGVKIAGMGGDDHVDATHTVSGKKLPTNEEDTINGAGGNDSLNALGGNDSVDGGTGNDTLRGSAGNDTLIGGAGKDRLTGDAGADHFRLNASLGSSNIDTIVDFNHSQADIIELDNAVMAALGHKTGALGSQFYAHAGAKNGHDANDHVVYNTSTGALYYDSNGSGAGGLVQIAVIGTGSHPHLSADDFGIV